MRLKKSTAHSPACLMTGGWEPWAICGQIGNWVLVCQKSSIFNPQHLARFALAVGVVGIEKRQGVERIRTVGLWR